MYRQRILRNIFDTKTILIQYKSFSLFQTNKLKLNDIVKEAENVVGYPTSFLNLRWILDDNIINVASEASKLLETKHPLLEIAKNFLLRDNMLNWSLIVLLISKAAGLNPNFKEIECDRIAGILHSQRIIAEVTDILRISNKIHENIIHIESDKAGDLQFGNNLALLYGDHLLSIINIDIVQLRNSHILNIISSCLRDLVEGSFLGPRDGQDRPLPHRPLPRQSIIDIPLEFGNKPFQIKPVIGNMRSEWILRNLLNGATLLGKCCQCSLILGGHTKNLQELGHSFGRNFALALQLANEKKDVYDEDQFSLVSAPIMLYLEDNPEFYCEIEKGLINVDSVDYNFIRETVLNDSNIQKCNELQTQFTNNALRDLSQFCDSNSKSSLVKIIQSL